FEFEHEDHGNLTRITDPEENDRTLTYDAHGRLTEQLWGPLNADDSGAVDEIYTYDAVSGVLKTVDDGDESIDQITAMAGQGLNSTQAPDADQALARIKDALDHTTTYALDFEGRVLKETSPSGITQSWKRNTRGQVVTYTDGRNLETRYTYDD